MPTLLDTPTSSRALPGSPTRPRGLAPLVAALGLISVACVAPNDHPVPANAIRIGTTLPFSGERAASGAAIERAMRLAVASVNAGGQLQGHPLALEVRDSHSDDDWGTTETEAMLMAANLPVTTIPYFIGPEEPRIAYQVEDAIEKYKMVNLLPGLTSPVIHDPSANAAWFRISPSPNYLACALAKRMFHDGISRVNAITDPDDYSGTFATIFGFVFTSMGGTMLPGLQLPASGSSFDDVFATIERFSPDATLLITSPSVGAGFLQEWAVRGKVGKFYLGPPLNNPALLRNVPAGVLEGLLGISPDLGPNGAVFDTYFATATNVPALAGSHYYFDAVALLALTIAESMAQTGAVPDPGTFRTHMDNVTSASGQVVTFDNLAAGLAALAAGQKIQYSGAAGNYVLNSDGDSIDTHASIWQIAGNNFVNIGSEQCSDAEVYSGYGK